MPSKLENHSDQIAKRLREGATYEVISAELKSKGVQTTRQNLQAWVQRRAKKLESRKALAETITPTTTA